MVSDTVVQYKRKRHYGWLLLVLVIGIFGFLSYRPVMRLKEIPPAEFMEMPEKWDAERRAAEGPVALAYWACARQAIQVKYAYGTPLPASPPPEFSIADENLPRGRSGKSKKAKLLYWSKLQKAWALPQSWDKSYEWSTEWVGQALRDSQGFAVRIWQRILMDFET